MRVNGPDSVLGPASLMILRSVFGHDERAGLISGILVEVGGTGMVGRVAAVCRMWTVRLVVRASL